MKKISDNKLIKKILEKSSSSAKQMLAKKYSSLVFAIAGKYVRRVQVSFEILVGEGMIGLYRAVENVKLKDKKIGFKEFARTFIERSIYTFITDCTDEKVNPP